MSYIKNNSVLLDTNNIKSFICLVKILVCGQKAFFFAGLKQC